MRDFASSNGASEVKWQQRMHKGWLNYSLLCYKYLQILVGVVSNRDNKSLAECSDSDGYFRLFASTVDLL